MVDSPFGPLGLLQPLAPDVALVHAAAADPAGNLAFSEPLLDGVWGAWAARRGVVATVERVVDDLEGLGHRVRVPGHRVLAVVEAPYGAHPGGCYAPGPARPELRRGHRALERRGRRGRQGRIRRLRGAVGARARRRTRTTSPSSARTGCCGSKGAPTPCRGRPTPTPTPWSRIPPSRRGSRRPRLGAREVERVVADGGGRRRAGRARAWPTWRRGSPWHGRERPAAR